MKEGNLVHILEEDNSHSAAIRKKVMLKKGDVPHLMQLAQATFPDGTDVVEPHSHTDMWECYMIEEGTAQIVVDGVSYDVSRGSYVLINPGEVHSITNARELVLRYFGITR